MAPANPLQGFGRGVAEARLPWQPRVKGGTEQPDARGSRDQDVRVLDVVWYAHGKRFKPWRDVCREITSHEVSDWTKYFAQPPVLLEKF